MIIGIDEQANDWCYSFSFSGTDVNTWLFIILFLFYFVLFSSSFVFIILCLHRCYNAKLCLFISEFTDSIAPFVHICYGVGYCDPCMHKWYCAGLLFVYFQLWNGLQYSLPKLWQVVLPNVSVQCGIVHSDVYGLLYCSCHIVVFHAYYFQYFPSDLRKLPMWPVKACLQIKIFSVFESNWTSSILAT